MQGCRHPRLLPALAGLLLLALTGCAPSTGASVSANARVAPAQAPQLAMRLGDLPPGFLLQTDLTPTNAQLAAVLRQPDAAMWLQAHGRLAGVYRVFAFTLSEPTALSGVTQAQIEVDVFGAPQAAQDWFAARGAQLVGQGAPLTVAAPGQRHRVQSQTYHAGDIVAAATVIAFTERNVYAEIATTTVGQDLSIADTERFADQIDARILAAAH